MPNWCDNTLIISGSPEAVSSLVAFVGKPIEDNDNPLFSISNIKVATPDSPPLSKLHKSKGPNDSYNNHVNSWGTKCDVSGDVQMNYVEGGDTASYWFDSAWAPITQVIKKLSEIYPEVSITYSYYETNNDFWGIEEYSDGEMTSEEGGGMCHTAWKTLGLDCWNCQQYEEDPEEYAEYLYTDCPDYVEEKKEVEVSA